MLRTPSHLHGAGEVIRRSFPYTIRLLNFKSCYSNEKYLSRASSSPVPRTQQVLGHACQEPPNLLPLHLLLQRDPLQRTPSVKVLTKHPPRAPDLIVLHAFRYGTKILCFLPRCLLGIQDNMGRIPLQVRRVVQTRVRGGYWWSAPRVCYDSLCSLASGFGS